MLGFGDEFQIFCTSLKGFTSQFATTVPFFIFTCNRSCFYFSFISMHIFSSRGFTVELFFFVRFVLLCSKILRVGYRDETDTGQKMSNLRLKLNGTN